MRRRADAEHPRDRLPQVGKRRPDAQVAARAGEEGLRGVEIGAAGAQRVVAEGRGVLGGAQCLREPAEGPADALSEKPRVRAQPAMALRHLEDTGRYGSVQIDQAKQIIGFKEKQAEGYPGYINGGIYMINKEFFIENNFPGKFSIEKDCFEKFYSRSRMFGYPARGYFLDIGIPEDYMRAHDEFKQFED